MLGVMIGFEPRKNGIGWFSFRGVVLTVDWGSGGGPKVSTKFHNPLFIKGMDGNVPTKDTGGIGATRTKSGSNRFMIGGL